MSAPNTTNSPIQSQFSKSGTSPRPNGVVIRVATSSSVNVSSGWFADRGGLGDKTLACFVIAENHVRDVVSGMTRRCGNREPGEPDDVELPVLGPGDDEGEDGLAVRDPGDGPGDEGLVAILIGRIGRIDNEAVAV